MPCVAAKAAARSDDREPTATKRWSVLACTVRTKSPAISPGASRPQRSTGPPRRGVARDSGSVFTPQAYGRRLEVELPADRVLLVRSAGLAHEAERRVRVIAEVADRFERLALRHEVDHAREAPRAVAAVRRAEAV